MSHKKFTPNNNNNHLVGPPRGKSLDGQAPTYSTMQVRTLKLSANVNTVNENDDNNKVIISNNVLKTRDNSSWTSSSLSSSSTSSSSAHTYDQRTAHIWNYDIV